MLMAYLINSDKMLCEKAQEIELLKQQHKESVEVNHKANLNLTDEITSLKIALEQTKEVIKIEEEKTANMQVSNDALSRDLMMSQVILFFY